MDFGSHDNLNNYVAQGEVCFRTEDLANLTAVATLSGTDLETTTVDMDNNGEGCFQLPDVRSLAVGLYNVTVEATDTEGVSGGLDESIGTVQVQAHENSLPTVGISFDASAYTQISGVVSEANGSIEFECTNPTDAEDGIPANGISGAYAIDGGTESLVDIDENNRFSVLVTNIGGGTVGARCVVTDSMNGVGTSETLSIPIANEPAQVNTPPVISLATFTATINQATAFPSTACYDAESGYRPLSPSSVTVTNPGPTDIAVSCTDGVNVTNGVVSVTGECPVGDVWDGLGCTLL